VLASFGTTSDALLDIVSGRFRPTGKMPFTTPISEAAVERQLSDVPGNLKGPEYGLFKLKEGLEYKGKIGLEALKNNRPYFLNEGLLFLGEWNYLI